MKKNLKSVAFVLGMMAISTVAMTSCGEAAEKAKDAAAGHADKVEAAGEMVKEKAGDIVPEAAKGTVNNMVDKGVEAVTGDSSTDTTAKCGDDKCGDDKCGDGAVKEVEDAAKTAVGDAKDAMVKEMKAH